MQVSEQAANRLTPVLRTQKSRGIDLGFFMSGGVYSPKKFTS